MASVRTEFQIAAPPEDVWAALRDFGALHQRLVPGFVTDARLEGNARVVTFFNGAVAREVLVDSDDDSRRLVYSVVESPLGSTHHNASAQVFPDGEGGSRFVWVTDLLPNELAAPTRDLMAHGARVIKETLESQTVVAGQPAPTL
jgi:uncharacterized protein YndB with AHSA1/START domain